MEHHNIWRDMHPSRSLINKTMQVTKNAIIVAEVLGGNGKHLKNKMSIDVEGMNKYQFNLFVGALLEVMGKQNQSEIKLNNKP